MAKKLLPTKLTDKEMVKCQAHSMSIQELAKQDVLYRIGLLSATSKIIREEFKDEHLANDVHSLITANND